MKNPIANRRFTGLSAIVLALAVTATIPASQALGQTGKVIANIPFDFQNGSDHLPAGHYTLVVDSDHIMHLQNGSIASIALIRPEINTNVTTGGKLVFRKYSNRYFLAEVRRPNQGVYSVLIKSKAEKRQQNAMNVTERNGTEVALLEPFK